MSKAQTMLVVCLNFLFLQFTYAQCPTGDIILPNQAAINSFVTDYPGCTALSGKLVIGQAGATASDITSLAPLSVLQSTEGLVVTSTTLLDDLQGLHNLTSIEGDILIHNNMELDELTQLQQATSSVKSISILSNPEIAELYGLENMVLEGGRLSIENNEALISLDGAPRFTDLEELRIVSNQMLADVSALQDLQTAGMVKFASLPVLTNLTGLDMLHTVSSSFEITDLATLADLLGLSSLIKVNDMFTLALLPEVLRLKGLEQLKEVGNLVIMDNASLYTIEALFSLTTVKSIQVASSPSLVDLKGLEGVVFVDYIFVLDNPLLKNLTGFNNLKEVRAGVQIAGNASLESFVGIDQVQRIMGVLAIVNNDELVTLAEIEDVSLEGSMLFIMENDKLITCHVDNVCDYVDLFPAQSFVANNEAGCNTTTEINNNCALFSLPVEMVSFDAVKKGATAELTWVTANEYNNKGFDVMRSIDGQNWNSLVWVDAKINTKSSNIYKYTDKHEINGEVYYRIVQVDSDDTRKTSDVKSLKFGYVSTGLFVYPNPANDKVTIEYQSYDDAEEVDVRLYDLTGKSKTFVRDDHSGLIELDLQGLPHGYYTLIVNGTTSKLLITGQTN